MSVNQDEIFVQTKENAHREFSFVDEDTVPLNASKPVPLQPLKPTSAIVVTGYVPPDALRFSVNLLCKAGGNIALHFNARLDRGYVVRNTKFKGCWEEEETCSPAAHTAFRRNSYVHILIFCTANEYQIAVNGEHFCAFSYRMPLEDVTNLEINGSLEDTRFRQFELFVYPDPSLCRPSNVLSLKVDRPIVDFLGVPITVDIENEFKIGTRLFIAGRLKLLPYSFYVNLQKGKAIYPHPVIALHLNPRFLYGNNAPYVVMNCWTNGSWGHEERHSGHLSWMPGRDFLLTESSKKSSLNGKENINWQLSAKLNGDDSQYQLDAGQKNFGATQCSECGVVYQVGDPEDENAHLNYHNNRKSLKFPGWKMERVIMEDLFTSSRIILVEPGDSKLCWKKVSEVLAYVDTDLGLVDTKPSDYESKKVYLYIRDKAIIGVLVAEHITTAHRMIPELLELNCCMAESSPAKCGINVVWTDLNHRRQGIATKLVDILRAQFYFGYVMSADDIAFSIPTVSGKMFAEKYTKTRNFKVYS